MRAGGAWQSTIGNDLAGKQLGVIGLGKLGTRVAAVAKAFGMNVTAWSRNLTADRCAAAGVTFAASLDALLESSDIVTLHVVLSARTQGLLGERELDRMKPTAILINTSRGPLVDEPALIAALSARTIAGAGLDVFDVEPLPPAIRFVACPMSSRPRTSATSRPRTTARSMPGPWRTSWHGWTVDRSGSSWAGLIGWCVRRPHRRCGGAMDAAACAETLPSRPETVITPSRHAGPAGRSRDAVRGAYENAGLDAPSYASSITG